MKREEEQGTPGSDIHAWSCQQVKEWISEPSKLASWSQHEDGTGHRWRDWGYRTLPEENFAYIHVGHARSVPRRRRQSVTVLGGDESAGTGTSITADAMAKTPESVAKQVSVEMFGDDAGRCHLIAERLFVRPARPTSLLPSSSQHHSVQDLVRHRFRLEGLGCATILTALWH